MKKLKYEYISRIHFLEKGIDLSKYPNAKQIIVIDPIHKEYLYISAELYLECEKNDLICLLIQY